RWIIFLIDTSICFLSLMLAYQVRFNFRVPENEIALWKYAVPTVLGVRIISFLISRVYQGIIRYTSNKDAQRIFYTITAGSVALAVANILSYHSIGFYLVPYSIVIIEYFATVFSMTAFRILVKTVYMEVRNPSGERKKVIIYGAGESGVITKRTLDRDAGSRYKVIAFVDDNPAKAGKTLEGIRIYRADTELEELLHANVIDHLILSIQNVPAPAKQALVEKCLAFGVNVLNVPPVTTWINGQLSFNQIRNIRIEDLLERPPIRLDTEEIRRQLEGRVILVTGGAGSIGSEVVRQLLPFNPKKVIVLDQAESALYDLELELQERYKFRQFETVIADVRQIDRMRRVFEAFHPQVVFHAAAYKHVPVMEHNPSEAILTNVHGTRVTADLAHEFGVEKFVLISTDKAVNPTNIMGATKRIAEIYCQSLGTVSATRFITTRFGNVLDSNGSVIPRFRKQIESGGPVTVTHPDITRYFMTIPEACQLVLEAASMGKGGEIYLFDMGTSVRIYDLAKKMIRLAGLTLDKDIRIEITGLRPGEKLQEELLADKETSLPTHHEKILVAKVRPYDFKVIQSDIEELVSLFSTQRNDAIVRKMKQMVPEYVSANSEFEKLDVVTGKVDG
ncbi:MAG TPA: nucleoside-diphosphate sugar epimerase/dehydratase, partial [Bacteroidia bacterium]|nr:nucleoside-diphosphate sugar epimerase/dehydratase [Bacteroidia bacterium]